MARHRADRPTNPMRRRLAAVVLGIVGVAGLGLASASQVTVGSGTLGVGTAMVASCQGAAQITVKFTSAWAPTPAPASYRATQVTLSNVDDDCSGLTYQIQLTNGGSAVGTELSGPVSLTAGALTVNIPSTPVTSIGGVAVVIRS